MARQQLVAYAFAMVVALALCQTATADGSRKLLESEVAEAVEPEPALVEAMVQPAAEHRQLWINPAAQPGSKRGYNVILSIVCPGHYTTVTAFKLRAGMKVKGFAVDNDKLAFGGNAAMAGYQFTASFTMNFPNAASKEEALALASSLTAPGLAAAAKTPVTSIFFSAFKPT